MKTTTALLAILIAVLPAACDKGARVECDCAYPNSVTVYVPDQPDAQLAVSGGACPGAPICVVHPDGGGCVQYVVEATQAGSCHVSATAPDGRQQSADLSAQLTRSDSCCGNSFAINPAGPLTFTFAPPAGQDGSADGGG